MCFCKPSDFGESEKDIILKYQQASILSGAKYIYYKTKGEDGIKIATESDFKAFREANSSLFKGKKPKVEFEDVRKFGKPSNT